MNISYSFVIPHHNTPILLNRLLKSIPMRKDVQIIVIDDNSDDDKRPIIQDDSVEVIYLDSQQSKGAGKARNVGLRRASGNWLVFADSDDFFVDNVLEILDQYKESKSDMVLFKANSVNSDTLEPANRHFGINKLIDDCIDGKITQLELSLSVQQPWCRMIRRNFVNDHNILFDEVIASNDTMFTTKVSCQAKYIEISKDILYVVTFRKGSLWNSRKNPDNYLSRIGVAIERAQYLKSLGIPTIPLIVPYVQYGYIDFKDNIKALCMIVKSGMLFLDIFPFLKKQINKFFHI